MKKKIIFSILILIIFMGIAKLFASTYVETAQFKEGEYLSPAIYVAKKAHNGYGTFAQERFIKKSDGTPVYCVEPFVKVQTNVDYTGYVDDVSEFIQNATYTKDTFTNAQWEKAVLIANYGYRYGNHTEDKWYAVTQVMIWKAVYNGIEIGFCNSLSDAQNFNYNNNLYASEQAEINKLVNEHNIVPNFNITDNLIVGQTSTFNDSNNVLSKYEIVGTTNCNANKSGNSINITPTGVGAVSVQLCKGNPNGQKPVLYVKAGAQNLMMAGSVVKYSSVNAQAVGGRITIRKEDNETTAVQGDATFEGAVFGIYNSGNSEVGRVTLGADGTGLSNYLEPGTYTIREIQAPRGYIASQETYTVNISLDNLNPSQLVKENVIKGNIQILKRLDSTDYEPEINLAGSQFKVTLKSNPSIEYYTNISGEDGICKIENIPYGTYTLEEVKVPDESLKLDNFDVKIEENNKTYEYTKIDKSKKIKLKVKKVDIDRKDTDSPDYTQGDAKLEGAEFEIYRDRDCKDLVTTITVDHKDGDGYWCAETGTIRTATFYAKESKAPEGYLKDDNIYTFEAVNTEQSIELEPKEVVSKETVSRGSLKIVKYDEGNLVGTDKSPAEGAILRLSLDSNPDKYYEVEINDVGYAEFVEEESREKYYPYTIPYGKYTLSETKGSNTGAHTHYFSKPEAVNIVRQEQREYRILEEEPVQMFLTLRKLDKDNNATVNIAGAKFKVWNYTKGEWVRQTESQIDEFVTGEDGSVTLPEKLNAGEYIIYEIESPNGYYLQDELRLPENEEDIGVKDKGGKYVLIDKAAMGVEGDATESVTDLYYIVDLPNEPLKGKIQIEKKGEMLTDVVIDSTEYGEKYTPKYEERSLLGVTYDIYASQDIKSPDGTQTYITSGTKVDTITTGEDGIAESKDLYLGEYEIREVVTPQGYITDNNIENITLTNDNKLVKVETTSKSLSNIRQKLYISIDKKYADSGYSASNTQERKTIFGIYADNDILNYEDRIVISKDSLVDIIEITDENTGNGNIDLPTGGYYAKELYTSYPYSISEEKFPIQLTYTNNTDEIVTKSSESITNDFEKANLNILKLSSSTINDVLITGSNLDKSTLDERAQEILENLMSKTQEEIIKYFEDEKIISIPEVEYGIYLDSECINPLYIKDENGNYTELKITTDNLGMGKLENLPLGIYYLKEENVPVKYLANNNAIKVELTKENKDQTVYKIMINDSIVGPVLSKLDLFTSQAVPNCKFEIWDEDNNVIATLVTDEDGNGFIPYDLLEDGRKYKYVEIDAPDIYKGDGKLYELNTEPIEFVASFTVDENGIKYNNKTVAENYRTKGDIEFVKTDFLEAKAIPNCRFELKSLETDFVVEGVTNDEGIYVFKDIPYGKYTYTEIEAPGYIVDKTPHEIEINTKNTKIEVKNDKLPFTGDIDILSIILIGIISLFGITYAYKKIRVNEQ